MLVAAGRVASDPQAAPSFGGRFVASSSALYLRAAVAVVAFVGMAPSLLAQQLPAAPPGYWRPDPNSRFLRHIPEAVGLTDGEEQRCSGYSSLFLAGENESREYENCIALTLKDKLAKARAPGPIIIEMPAGPSVPIRPPAGPEPTTTDCVEIGTLLRCTTR